jgi:GT2 family glycosyltransferase
LNTIVAASRLVPEAEVEQGLDATAFVAARPLVRGKFLYVGEEKFWVKGVTYGTFGPEADGSSYPSAEQVDADFAAMAEAGLNSVRVYTVPPRWLLDAAAAHGLRVMVGLPWEQHIAFLDGGRPAEIVARVTEQIRQCAGHPAILCYAIGNEIPAPIVRWYGRGRVRGFLARLAKVVRREDPGALVTYVNFPTTEYLELPFLDFLSFNVYLETEEKLRSYLARLQNLAGERPLLMAEIGLDSRSNGEAKQAEVLKWQVATTFEMGAVGAVMFAWTDEWWRGGHNIEDWDFGLTTRDRRPKLALSEVARTFADTPFPPGQAWPRISVVVCSYNGAGTIGETLEHLARVDYPDYEVIVVNDGSTDATGEIAAKFDVRLFETENRGLSNARNTGMDLATGEIIAYTDDDAYPDPHWLKFLAAAFMRSDHAAMGGPNIGPPTDGDLAECVANAPGGPVHVLVADEVAEHIPGCNMAYRAEVLRAVGGFDPQFRVAGDDVDVCWRIQDRGHTLGFCAAAMVWHHRRPSISRYLKQQRGYARAEALLAEKWPGKYNAVGHLSWHGRLYGRGLIETLLPHHRIYHGAWGSALFQSVYQTAPGLFASLPLMPEWCVLVGTVTALALLGLAWSPLLWFTPVAALAIGATLVQAARGGLDAQFNGRDPARIWKLRLIVAWLHLLQPVARLQGRIQHGLGPWRWRGPSIQPWLGAFEKRLWDESWASLEARLGAIDARLHAAKAVVVAGGDFDRWDFQVKGGLFGAIQVRAMVEEHGAGRQLVRLHAWPRPARAAVLLVLGLLALAMAAASDHAWFAASALAVVAMAVGLFIYSNCTVAMQQWSAAVDDYAADAGLVSPARA